MYNGISYSCIEDIKTLLFIHCTVKTINELRYGLFDKVLFYRSADKSIELEYDFGDGWLHEVKLSSVADYEDDEPQLVRFVKGFTIDSERLKGNGGGQYWYELLNTIKDIRCLAYKENIRRLYLIVLGGSPRRMICDSLNGNPEGTILGDADYWELYLHWGLRAANQRYYTLPHRR